MIILNNSRLPGFAYAVRCAFSIPSLDLSAQTADTTTASLGIKPVTFNVSCVIPFKAGGELTKLLNMAREVDESGDRLEYSIVNISAQAAGVAKVIFAETFSYAYSDDLEVWNVSFSLREIQSIAEKKEQRLKPATTQSTSEEGQTIGNNQNVNADFLLSEVENLNAGNFSGIQALLDSIDKVL